MSKIAKMITEEFFKNSAIISILPSECFYAANFGEGLRLFICAKNSYPFDSMVAQPSADYIEFMEEGASCLEYRAVNLADIFAAVDRATEHDYDPYQSIIEYPLNINFEKARFTLNSGDALDLLEIEISSGGPSEWLYVLADDSGQVFNLFFGYSEALKPPLYILPTSEQYGVFERFAGHFIGINE